MPRANSKYFLIHNGIDTNHCKISTSRMWERKDDKTYYDNWWFKFDESELKDKKYLLFCGALDYSNKEFKVFKIPTSYVLNNLSKVDRTPDGWINIYLSFKDCIDLRNKSNLSFKEFLIS